MLQTDIKKGFYLSYVLAGTARYSVYVFVISVYFIYLTRIQGVPLNTAIGIVLGLKLLDLIKDPIIGYIIDVVASKNHFNKYKTFIFYAGIVNSLFTFLLFEIPALIPRAMVSYCIICFFIWSISLSFLEIPYLGLISSVKSVKENRVNLSSLHNFSVCLGTLITAFVVYILANQLQCSLQTFTNYAGLFAFMQLAFTIYLVKNIERNTKVTKELKFTLFAKLFLDNSQLILLLIMFLLQQIAMYIFIGSHGFFIAQLESDNREIPCLVLVHGSWIICAMLNCLCFRLWTKYFSRKNLLIGSTIAVVALTVLIISLALTNNLAAYQMIVIYCLLAVAFTLQMLIFTTMLADVVDYTEFKTTYRVECLCFSISSLSTKVGLFTSMLLCGVELSLAGFFIDGSYARLEAENVNINFVLVIAGLILMLCIYLLYYRLNGRFFENILSSLQKFATNDHYKVKNTNSVRYALDEKCVITNLKADSLDEVIEILTDRLKMVKAITSRHEFIQGINEKLKNDPFGLSHGVALPHARGPYVKRSALAVATLTKPLDCGALDGEDCDLIFILATPDDQKSHMDLISNLSLILADNKNIERLKKSGSTEEITKRLIACERSIFGR